MKTPSHHRLPASRFLADWQIKSLIVLAVLLTPVVWAGCSVAEHRETLSFWFDGVPTAEQEEAARQAELRREAAAAVGPLTSEQRAAMLAVRVEEVFTSTHKPVESKECGRCHLMPEGSQGSSASATLLAPKSELCFHCHEAPQGTFTHGPAASGNCALCHQSHTSLNPHLLRISPMAELCKACHAPEDLIDQQGHLEYEEFDCIDCHDPHASEQEYLLHAEYPRIAELSE